MRTLEVIEKELKDVQERLKPVEKVREELVKESNKLYEELVQYKLDKGMFAPMDELKNHCGKNIISIDLVEKMPDGTLKKDFLCGEILKVTTDGRLLYSDEYDGVMDYDESLGLYKKRNRGCDTTHNYVGYLDVLFELVD